jgi:predicted RNA binding protein YcfA (HicA-like mRNA interferase family)
MSKILSKTEIIHDKYLKKDMTATTVVKKDKSKMKPDDIKNIAERMLLKYPKKKLMIKVLSANGYFQIKGFHESLDVILEEEVYLNGQETVQKKEYSAIYKATFYLL